MRYESAGSLWRASILTREMDSAKNIHAALGTIQRDTGYSLAHDFGTRAQHEPRNGLLAACIVGNPPAMAELDILKAFMHLCTNRHGRRSDCTHNRAALLDREDTLALQMALRSVCTRLKQHYPIRILFYGE
jgi:hypothetical protein